jgi:hypothetical protein
METSFQTTLRRLDQPTNTQPSYMETRSAVIALHHGPMGHFGIDKTFESAKTSGFDQVNLKEDIKELLSTVLHANR